MSFIRAIIGGIFDALFGWMQKQKEKPPTAKDANTPKEIRDDLGDAVSDFLRDKDRHDH